MTDHPAEGPAVDDDAFLARFEDGTWPAGQWRHREHLKVAYLYVTRHPLADAIDRMRAGVRALNASHGTIDGPDSGYHETLTQAWMHLVHLAVQAHGPQANADAFVDAHPELLVKQAVLRFYSRERIRSAAARQGFVAPDLAPFTALPTVTA